MIDRDPFSPEIDDLDTRATGPAVEPTELQASDIVDDPPRPPGPGWFEAGGWFLGILGLKFVAGLLMLVVIVVIELSEAGFSPEALRALRNESAIMQLTSDWMLELTACDQVLFLMMVLVAVPLRLGWPREKGLPLLAGVRRRLGTGRLARRHLLMVLAIMMPMSLICSGMGVAADHLWNQLIDYQPWLRGFDEVQAMEVIRQLIEQTSIPVLVVVVAVLPAIGEELVFRGVIGRGLVARYGVVPGVLATSMLFAMAHLHPVHAVAIFPLGIVLHLLYLVTRSIWAPILLHFLNNAWAIVATKLSDSSSMLQLADDEPVPLILSIAAICSVAVLIYLWKSRVEYRLPDGSAWVPGHATIEPPDRSLGALARFRTAGILTTVNAMLALVAFYVVMMALVLDPERENQVSSPARFSEEPGDSGSRMTEDRIADRQPVSSGCWLVGNAAALELIPRFEFPGPRSTFMMALSFVQVANREGVVR